MNLKDIDYEQLRLQLEKLLENLIQFMEKL